MHWLFKYLNIDFVANMRFLRKIVIIICGLITFCTRVGEIEPFNINETVFANVLLTALQYALAYSYRSHLSYSAGAACCLQYLFTI